MQPAYAPHIAGISSRGSTPAASNDSARSTVVAEDLPPDMFVAAGPKAIAKILSRYGLRKDGKLAATVATAERALVHRRP